jgi:hypothetical protein
MLDFQIKPTPTAEEVAQARQNALNATHPASWVWNEETASYVAPIASPTDGYPYLWDEATNNWTPFPDYPRG